MISSKQALTLTTYVCPRCGDRQHVHPATYLVAHHCPRNLTSRGHPSWTRYQPQPIDEGDAAA